ncbi:centromere protein J isoform X2 [Sphaeramia orbicularis]|uniref:centromere protein J isoform X2 n=1 Tax=Sphaeramia orbicularis TaxID=375764 RepID=UPI00117C0A68|nr:centromere protein J isoform X2 [Sphaeramia orbicularis]
MSSPDGLQSDFLARWMPSSARAGVILSPCPDLAASLRHIPPSLGPNDSFTSDFAPLPASVDSSCVDVDGSGGARPGTDGEIESPGEMATETQDLTVMMKLDQLRKWQQHMQEELKAHQLEELLCLQEEQQRLLGMINGSQHCTENHTESSGLPGADWGEDTLQAASYHRGSLHNPIINHHGQTQGSTCGLQQEQEVISTERQQCLSRGHNTEVEDSEEEGLWNSRDDGQDQDVDATLIPHYGAALVEDSDRRDDNTLHDRPIKPGIGGQKQTFEELLEEQLRLEEQRLKSIKQQQSADSIPKRAFLKRGEGLSRFTNRKPAAISKGATNGTHRLPVQRKIAILNKENRLKGCSSPPQGIRVESKAARTKILGIHQRRNTEESAQTYTEGRQTKRYPAHQSGPGEEQNSRKVGSAVEIVKQTGSHSMEPNPVSVLEGTRKTESILIRKKSSDSGVESPEGEKEEAGFPQDSFELQEKLWRECNWRLESMEQGEFELLEQAAEELSFSSNSSFVMKVLQMDRELQVAKGRHQRRLSSTPIKSPPRDAPQRHSSSTACNEICSSSEDSDSQIRDGMLKSKVGFNDKKQQDRERNDRHDHSNISSCGESEFEDQNAAVNSPSVPSTLCFPVQSNPPYDKRSYQDDDSCRDSASDVTQGDDAESDGVLSNTDNDTLTEGNDGQQGRIVFDDDDTWNDLEEAAGTSCDSRGVVSKATGSGSSPPERTLLRKVAVSKVVGTVTLTNQEPDPLPPPPTSQLMTKLFPSLKPKVQNTPVTVSSAAGESRKAEEEAGQHVQSQQLRQRLVELEIEIERFKKENAALCKLRQENEKHQESLRKERLEFEQMRTEELSKFEEYKKEENRKLQKERKLFEKHVSAARAIPDKKEREEIQMLKQQLSSLQEELKRRESRWASTHSRLRQQIDTLNQDNRSLRDEVCMLEKLRLSTWRKTSMDAEKDKEGRDKTSVIKGVKFASPLASRSSGTSPPQISTAAVPKGSGRENGQGAAGSLSTGMKSSLRKPAGSDSSSVPVKRIEEKSTPSAKTEENPNQDSSLSSSPKTDSDSCEVTELESVQEVITHPDGKVEKVLSGGSRLIIFPNGTRKEVSADGLTMKVTFFNGDTKQITADQRVIYFYSGTKTTHITYPDGMEVLHFPNNQTEKHFPDGRKEITYPDQTVKNLFPNGQEESVLSDGTVIQVNPDGSKEIHFNTGQKEIHTPDYKSREYPDGTVKTVYSDGRQETHYPTGRVRVKDKDGNVILDNRA